MRKPTSLFLAVCSLFLIHLAGPAGAQDIESGLVAHYSFDDGENLGFDETENGWDAVAAGDAAPFENGALGSALSLDGDGDYLKLDQNIGSFEIISVSVYVRTLDYKNFISVFHCDDWNAADMHIHIKGQAPAHFSCGINGNSPTDQDSNFTLTEADLDIWHHLALVYDSTGQTMDFYVDGEPDLKGTYGASGPVDLGPLAIGAWKNGANFTRFLNGFLDELRIYDRALTLEDVEELSKHKPAQKPSFVDVPEHDFYYPAEFAYTAAFTVTAFPAAEVELAAPDGATISEEGMGSYILTYELPDPAPESFDVTLEASNSEGAAEATWTVSKFKTMLRGSWCIAEGQGTLAMDNAGEDGSQDAVFMDMDETAWVEGEVSEWALQFDGTNSAGSYLQAEGTEEYDPHADFTWAAWVKTPDATGETPGQYGGGALLSRSEGTWSRGEQVLMLDPNPSPTWTEFPGQLKFDVGWVDYVGARTPVDDGEWHHVALTVKFNIDGATGDRVRLYVDGERSQLWSSGNPLEDSYSGWDIEAQGEPAAGLKFGRHSTDRGKYFTGSLDDIRVWNYALTDEEIYEVYENPAGNCPDGAGAGVAIYMADVNGDYKTFEPNVADAIFLLNYLFASGEAPPCAKAADTNDDNKLDISDAVRLLGYLFTGNTIVAPDGTTFAPQDHPGCTQYSTEDVPEITVPEALPGCQTQCGGE